MNRRGFFKFALGAVAAVATGEALKALEPKGLVIGREFGADFYMTAADLTDFDKADVHAMNYYGYVGEGCEPFEMNEYQRRIFESIQQCHSKVILKPRRVAFIEQHPYGPRLYTIPYRAMPDRHDHLTEVIRI